MKFSGTGGSIDKTINFVCCDSILAQLLAVIYLSLYIESLLISDVFYLACFPSLKNWAFSSNTNKLIINCSVIYNTGAFRRTCTILSGDAKCSYFWIKQQFYTLAPENVRGIHSSHS